MPIKIRIKDCSEVKNHPELKKFAGKVRLAEPISQNAYRFSFSASSGFAGPHNETHIVSSRLVEVLQSQ